MRKDAKIYILIGFIIFILAGGIFSFILTHSYQEIIFENTKNGIASLTTQAIDTAFHKQQASALKVIEVTARNKQLGKLIKKKKLPEIKDFFAEEFAQNAFTGGELEAVGFSVFTKRMDFITHVNSNDYKVADFPEDILKKLKARKKTERFKAFYFDWNSNGIPVNTTIVPVGGLRLKGYVALTIYPAPSFKEIPNMVGGNVEIYSVDGKNLLEKLHFTNHSDDDSGKHGSDSYHNKDSLEIYIPYPNNNPIMQVKVIRSFGDLMGTLNSLRIKMFSAFALIMGVLVFAILIFFRKQVLSQVYLALNRIEAIARGDVSGEDVKVTLDDEIGAMVKGVNVMSKSLHSFVSMLNKSTTTLSSISEDYSATIEEMNGSLNQINENVTNTSAMTENMTQVYNNSQRIADNIRSGFTNIETISQESVTQVIELTEFADQIKQVITMVDNISDQISLLALNANIEAARAGDAGLGFAVVAEEVKKLAEESTSATAEITKKVQTLVDSVHTTRNNLEGVTTVVEENVSQLAELDGAMNEVLESSEAISNNVSNIATAMREQSEAMGASTEQFVKIKEISEDIRDEAGKFKL